MPTKPLKIEVFVCYLVHLELVQRVSENRPTRIGVLPGAFNPPTVAHISLLEAARQHVDEVLCVLPRTFPHKDYLGATLAERVTMLKSISGADFSIALSDRGLFREIAAEAREIYGPETLLYFICGADAAERIVTWDYGRAGVAEEMLAEFELLVAPRAGVYAAPEHLQHRIHELEVRCDLAEVSSTDVRERIASGREWGHLVPASIREQVERIYS